MERIQIYSNLLSNSTFSTAQDTTIYTPLEIPLGRTSLATSMWVNSYTDSAGTQANGIWRFTFQNANGGAKGTPSIPNWINIVNNQWYTIRMRITADSTNTHQAWLFGFTNDAQLGFQSGVHTDIGANILFGIPTVWTWLETPIQAHSSTSTGYPQFQFKSGGAGSVYLDEIQIINAAPNLVDAARGNTRMYYSYGDFDVASDTTGWGKELYPGAGSFPGITHSGISLVLDFTGAGSGTNQKGLKWTANNNLPGAATFPVSPGREFGVRATANTLAGPFNSLTLLVVSAYGVKTNGQQSIGQSPGSIIASASAGTLATSGIYRAIGKAVSPFYQYQFSVRSDITGLLSLDDVDLDQDQDNIKFGDGNLFP